MEISFNHNSAGLFIALSVLIAAGISFLLYFRGPDQLILTTAQKGFLAFLRFASLFLIFLFLFSPLIERTKKIRQLPIWAIAFDNSQSTQPFASSFEQFIQTLKQQLTEDYQLEFWAFGEKVENTESFTGTDCRSDYGQVIKSIKNNYINKNIGALILLGDGIYNQGQNPENLTSQLKFPIYSVGIGDTTRVTDARISSIKTNKVTFLKNKFPVEIELKFSELKNQIAYIDIENNNKKIYSGTTSIVSDDDFKLEFVNLEATATGLQHYKIRIRPFNGEVNLKNNEYEFVIQVLEEKQKILMLSNGPHPDLGAIRTSISELQNYETRYFTGNEIPDSLSSYSLIILNQLPSAKNAASKLLSRIRENRIPVLFLIGTTSLLEQLNSLDMGLKISASPNTEEVQPSFDNNFSLFELQNQTKEILEALPPLVSPFGNTELAPTMQNLAFQNIRNIRTSKTMLAFGTEKGRKTGFIIGEGVWRWRLSDYQANGNHDAFNELIQKTIQYLVLRENEDNFNVHYPTLFQETDEIELTAKLYNDSYELVNTPDVNILIKNNILKEFSYTFDRTDDHYRLNAGNLEPGDYTFKAETKLGNQNFAEQGSFSIVKNDIETQNNRADFGVLYQLSQQTGGQFYSLDKQDALHKDIRNNKQIVVQKHQQNIQTEWINLKILFFMLALFLGVEWFFRKYWGTY